MTELQIQIRRKGGGPNPETDDLFEVQINGIVQAHYADRESVRRIIMHALDATTSN